MVQDPRLALITGGCGFIGANLTRHLLAAGWRVRLADDLSVGRREEVAGLPVELLVGDISAPAFARKAVEGVTDVVHLAATTSVLDSIVDPMRSAMMNVAGLVTLLQACVEAGVGRFVLASSGAAVGPAQPPMRETQLPRPASPYGASKLAGEAYCWAFAQSYGLETVALRFSNVYGPYSLHKNSAVHKFIRLVMNHEPITIYGDGTQTRDFIYVSDICDAIERAITVPLSGELFQIGTGRETLLGEMITMIERVSGRAIRREYAPPNAGEVPRNAAAIDKARGVLGFEAATSLERGLALTWDWYRQQLETPAGRAVVAMAGD